MKFTVNKMVLQSALQQLGKVTPTRSTLPILSSVHLSAKGNSLALRATDLEISQIITIEATISTEGELAVPHRTLLEITSELPEVDLEFEVSSGQKVQLTTPFGSYSIMGKPVSEFPSLPEVNRKQAVEISGPLLRRVIDKTSFAVSRDDIKPSLMGVLFRFSEDKFTAVATDSHRLVRFIWNEKLPGEYLGDNIVPVKFLNILSGYLEDVEVVTFNIGDNHIMVHSGNTELFTRIIEERFPDYESVFPQDNDKILSVKRDDLLAAVKRVSIFSNRTTHQLSLTLNPGTITLATEDAETVSAANEKVEADYEGEELVLGYNAHYLRDVISHLDGETIKADFKSSVSAALFHPTEQAPGEEITMLLMPIRLSD